MAREPVGFDPTTAKPVAKDHTQPAAPQQKFDPSTATTAHASAAPKPFLTPSMASQWAQGLEQRGMRVPAHLLRGFADMASDPLVPLNAVLGAPQRFVAGAEGRGQALKSPIPPWMNPRAIAGGLYGVFHPNDPSVQQQFEDSVGASKLKAKDPKTLGGMARNFGVDFGAQTLSDPTLGIGKLGGFTRLGGSINDLLRVAGDRALVSNNPAVANLAKWMIPHPEERLAFTPKGIAAVRGIRQSEALRAERQAHQDEDLLAKYKGQIAHGQVPPEVEQRLLKDAVVYGTPELRKEAIGFMQMQGHEIPDEWLAHPPEGILDYHLKEDYFPHMGQRTYPQDFVGALERRKPNAPSAGFEHAQHSDEISGDPTEAMTKRLAAARGVIRNRRLQKRLSEETGLPLSLTNAKGQEFYAKNADDARIGEHVKDTVKAFDVLNKPQPEQWAGVDALQAISQVGRDVLIGTNPLPHGKNISVLSYLAGGTPGLTKGLEYAMSGVPKELADRLDEGGAGTHFMLTQPGPISPTRLPIMRNIRGVSQRILDRIDTGMRAARLQQLDKEAPNLSEYEKMQRVNEDLGDYRNSPAYVQLAQGLGAQFPQWHGYVVPTTMARAFLRAPQRIMNIVRGNQLANQDVFQPAFGANMELGGPVTEAGEMSGGPYAFSRYMLSSSMVGPVISEMIKYSQSPSSFNLEDDPQLLSQLIPYLNVVGPQFGYNPFGSKAPPTMRSIAGLFGAYPKALVSMREKMIRDLMESQGVDRYRATQEVQRALAPFYRHR